MEKNNYTLIEKYLNGELNEEEILSFKTRLTEDTDFAQEYNLQKSMNIFLEKDKNAPALKKQFAKLGSEFFQEKNNEKVIPIDRKKGNRRSLYGMIGAIAAIALLLFIFNPFQSGNLYDQYAAHQPLALTEKSTNASIATEAETFFNQKKYDLAYKNITMYLQENSDDQKAQLVLGISALEIGKDEEARAIFQKIHEGNSALKNYGTWYLALAYLKNKDFDQTKNYLKQIPNSERSLYTKAEKLLGEMK